MKVRWRWTMARTQTGRRPATRWQAVTELGAAPAGMTAPTTRGALLGRVSRGPGSAVQRLTRLRPLAADPQTRGEARCRKRASSLGRRLTRPLGTRTRPAPQTVHHATRTPIHPAKRSVGGICANSGFQPRQDPPALGLPRADRLTQSRTPSRLELAFSDRLLEGRDAPVHDEAVRIDDERHRAFVPQHVDDHRQVRIVVGQHVPAAGL
jgi:hypothetical protein